MTVSGSKPTSMTAASRVATSTTMNVLLSSGPRWNGRWVSGTRASARSRESPVGALQQHGVVFHRRALAHHPARDTAVLERAQQLAIAEPRLAERQMASLAARAVLDAGDVDVEPRERAGAQPVADLLERRAELLVGVER